MRESEGVRESALTFRESSVQMRVPTLAANQERENFYQTMNILDLLVGKPLRTAEERAEQVGPAAGIPIFGLDALSSAAYGPEAALRKSRVSKPNASPARLPSEPTPRGRLSWNGCAR